MPQLLHQLLEAAAETRPGGVAVVHGARSSTYQELDERANQVAHALMENGVARGDRVGIHAEKSLESIVGIYGVLKAGAVYVPLDHQAPVSRLAYIVANCGIRHLVSSGMTARNWLPLTEAGASLRGLVVLDASLDDLPTPPPGVVLADHSTVEGRPSSRPNTETIGIDLAYILYTSGSTGDPKGVMLSHSNALAFVEWGVERFAVGPADRLSSHAPLHFDLSIFDLFAAAMASAVVVLVPPTASLFPVEIPRFIEREQITVWYSVPSILTMVTLRGGLGDGSCSSLRCLLFAGEVFPAKYLRRLMSLLPHVEFHNLYGPTETNVCTHYAVPPLPDHDDTPIPIGRAITGVEVLAVTPMGSIAGVEEQGELYVRGPTVMHGYWGDPERTQQVLLPNPFGMGASDLVYRTGDLVRMASDGCYHYVGRRDAQIKSRGYRIELGDIEAALQAHPEVLECVVLAVPDEIVTNRIHAVIVVDGDTTAGDLSQFCATRLPRYMIPEAFEFREELPKTSTGKVDRQRLKSSLRMESLE